MPSTSSSTTSADRVDSPHPLPANHPDTPSSSQNDSSRTISISLHLEAQNLPNMDTRGKSDPFTVVYKRAQTTTSNASIPSENWIKIGQTETVYNNLNPKWSTPFNIQYQFGVTTVLRFCVYDRDDKTDDLSKQDYIGEVRYTVAQIVLAHNQRLLSDLRNKSSRTSNGTLIIRHEEQKTDLGESVTFQFAVRRLRKGRKPFYVLSNKNIKDDDYSPVIYSEVHNSSSATAHHFLFKPITKSLSRLINADWDRKLQIEIMDYDSRGSHICHGSATFTLRTAKAAATSSKPQVFPLTRKKKRNGKVVDVAEFIIQRCQISEPFSFIDYIRSGVVINTVFAVDMSKSNGNPIDPNSLHYNNRATDNQYVVAMRQVGSVLATYDTSKSFPAFGFGAALPPEYAVAEQCFALTGNILQPECNGIEGVIDMYYTALSTVAPYEPCLYAPVLEHIIKMTKEANGVGKPTVYTIAMLITDGEFSDFDRVADCICEAADLPLSIIIVGVGNSRFLQLELLDGDDKRLRSSQGLPCSRDIVQFVQFHKHQYNPSQLTKEVLAEIPEQLVSYMRNKGIRPADLIRGSAKLPPAAAVTRPIIPQRTQPLPQTQVSLSQTQHAIGPTHIPVSPTHVPPPQQNMSQTTIPIQTPHPPTSQTQNPMSQTQYWYQTASAQHPRPVYPNQAAAATQYTAQYGQGHTPQMPTQYNMYNQQQMQHNPPISPGLTATHVAQQDEQTLNTPYNHSMGMQQHPYHQASYPHR